MNQLAFPLQWPAGWKRTPAGARERGAFDGTLDRIRAAMVREIDLLVLGEKARTHTMRNVVVISTNMPLRRDGELHAGARAPEDPGVAVYFERKGAKVCFACDKYDAVWKNMRAIQKTLEAMRGIERWGSSSLLDRAFTGFAALPAPSGRDCLAVLGIATSEGLTEDIVMSAWRATVKVVHPAAGGSEDALRAANEAKDLALTMVRKGGV